MQQAKKADPDLRLAAVCGLFCPACSIYIATTEDRQRLETLAKRFGISSEEAECRGCRSDKRFPFCKTCKMQKCSKEKGIDFCFQCAEYPCEELKTFQAAAPHWIELWEAQSRIKEAGWETWFAESAERYSCQSCGTLNSAYDTSCRACRTSPSNAYVKLHESKITTYVKTRPSGS